MSVGVFGFVPPRGLVPPRGRGRVPLLLAVGAIGVLLVVGAVSLLGARMGAQPAGPGAITGACGGLSVIGTPAVVDVIDAETGGSARVLKMSVTPNCAGTYVQGTFGSSFLRQATGFDFDQGFTVTASAAEEKLIYPVVNDRITIYDYTTWCTYNVGHGFEQDGWEGLGLYGLGCIAYVSPTQGTFYQSHTAVRKVRGVKGHLAPIPSTRWFADIAIATEDGQSIAKRISSAESRAEWTRDNATLAVATWTGNLVTGEAPPDATGVVAVYFEETKKWSLATLAEWDAYRTVDTMLRELTPQGYYMRWDGGIASAALTAIRASKAALPVPGQFTADGLGYEVSSAPRLQTPVIDLLIKGELLGIVRPVGVPDLAFVSVSPSPYHAGNPGTLAFRATNLGNVSAGFALSVTCGGVSVLASPLQVTLDPRAPKDVPVPFTVAAAGNYNCEGALTDLAGGAAAKSSRAVFALAVQVCQPALQQFAKFMPVSTAEFSGAVAPAALQQCKADGSGWETILDCSNVVTETYKANTCVAGVNFGLIGGKTNATPTQVKSWAEGGAQPSGSCKYEYEQVGGAPCSVDDRETGATPLGGIVCTALGTITPKTYETRAAAPVQFKGGQFTCAGAINSPSATVLSVTEVPEAAAAAATPLPAVPPGPMAPASPGPGAAPSGGAPQPTPGFEAVFAVAGLLAVAWLLNRRKG